MKSLLVGAAALVIGGCVGSAGVYYQDQNGGVLKISGDEQKALEDAR